MKSNLDLKYKTDTSLEKEGVWFEVDEGVRFKVRRLGGQNSQQLKKANAKFFKPYANQMKNDTLSYEKDLEINVKAFVEVLLADWEGVEVGGTVLSFTKENAIELLIGLPDLFSNLTNYCMEKDHYLVDLGNS